VSGALTDFNKAIELNSKYTDAYSHRGVLKYGLNDVSGALADYSKAIDLDPQNVISYVNRAYLKETLNDISGALADYNKAIELDPQFAITYVNRAYLKRDKIRDRKGAIQDFQQAANLYRQQGNTEDLQEAIDRLDELGATVNWW
jgi:tetratricopeptide (TPR) repeat protein